MNRTDISAESSVQENAKVVDFHTHYHPDNLPDFTTRYGYGGFLTLVKEDVPGNSENAEYAELKRGSKLLFKVTKPLWDLEQRIRFMDSHSIDMQVLSPLPSIFSYWAKADDTADLCRIVNNSIKKDCERFPDRFLPLFIVPMQAPELAVLEVERCVELGFKGCAIGTHINEWNLDAPELVPFWEECEDNGVAVFVHPTDVPVTRKDRKFWLPSVIGSSHETNRAITTLILGGVLEKFPRLKLCFAEGGGSYPFLQGRVEQSYFLKPELCAQQCDSSPKTFLNRIKCDSLVGSTKSLELIIDVLGSENVLFGSNFPLIPSSLLLPSEVSSTTLKENVKEKLKIGFDEVNDAKNLSAENKAKVLGLNALNFLGVDCSDVNVKAKQ